MKKISEITISQLSFRPVSMFFGRLQPAVFKKDDNTYGIRIKIGESYYNNNTKTSWDYFSLDNTGLIIESPRGYASRFNKKVRIIDIEKAVEDFKDKICD